MKNDKKKSISRAFNIFLVVNLIMVILNIIVRDSNMNDIIIKNISNILFYAFFEGSFIFFVYIFYILFRMKKSE